MQTLALALSVLVVLAALSAVGVDAGRLITYPPHISTKRGSYIVEFERHIPHTHVDKFHAMSDIVVDNHYTKAFNGISVSANSHTFDPLQLARFEGVNRVWPVRFYRPAVNLSSLNASADLYLHHVTGVERALTELGLNGTGVSIGIVDSGVDYMHPELGGCWKTPGCPWQHGEDLVGDKYDPASADPIIEPNPTPMDCDGHGTHVSGILAGRGPHVHGVAPGATFGMYRIFSCPVGGQQVQASDALIIKGIEAAFQNGHDIISLSLGSGSWAEDPLSIICAQAVEQGVVVVAAAGNDGMGGLYTASAPSVGAGVISVGSVDNWNITALSGTVTSSQGTQSIVLSPSNSDKYPFDFDSDTPLALPSSDNSNILGCAKYTTDMTGKIALVERGVCRFDAKLKNAYEAGAVGVLCYNNVPGYFAATLSQSMPIPIAGTTNEYGAYIASALAAGNVTIKAPKDNFGLFAAATGGQVSEFSSIGPSPELAMVPLISAPGGNILSTYPRKLGSYASESGTSMATPYISGTVALLKQARPDLSVNGITRLLVASGKPITHLRTGLKASPFESGAGLVNIYDAITSRAELDPPTLSINDSKVGPITGHAEFESLGTVRWAARTISIRNTDSKKSMRVSLDNKVANSLSSMLANGSYAYTPRIWPADGVSKPATDTLPRVHSLDADKLVAPGQSCSVTVFVVAPTGLKDSEHWYYSGFLEFTLQWDGEQTSSAYVVPYGGYNGNYSAQDVLSPPSEGLPAFVDIESGNPIEDLSTLVIGTNETVALVYGLAIPSRRVDITYVDSASGKTVGNPPDGNIQYSERSCPQCSIPFHSIVLSKFASVAGNRSEPSEVPAGKYHIHLKALRPFGDIDNDDDYQTWDSEDFIIS
ncbi:hypothetical protein H4S02_003320 [Coemansia sp. RSA 2611]|nr:hypothetical protein H4S02_003320 [Coemansia sp. RSA 2611]